MRQLPPVKSEYEPEVPQTNEYCFGGFKNLNSTPIPDEFFDILAVQLSEAELRVLLYIMRRTFGFKKKADAISLSQLTGGIRKRDGSMLDYGTGLSKPSVLKAVGGLKAKGIITIEKRTGEDGRNEVNVYQLRFVNEVSPTPVRSSSSQQVNSSIEYSGNGHTNSLSPDPRFVSARPAEPLAGYQPVPEKNSDPYGGQKQAGEFSRPGLKASPGESELPIGVNYLNQGSKATLPGAKINSEKGKAALPGGVNQIDGGSQNEIAAMVNLVNRQHGSLQESRKQVTETQTVLRPNSSLAFRVISQEEPAETFADEEALYINIQELVGAMLELGLSEKLALDLTQTYPPEYLWEKVRFTRQQPGGSSHQRLVKNTAGYLRRAIQDDYRPGPVNSARFAPLATNNFAERFPGAMAFLHKGQPEITRPTESYSLPLEEDYYQEETAPLPPIYRQSGYSHAVSGESLSGKPPTPPLHSPGVTALPSGGAERPRDFSRSTSTNYLPEPAEALTGLWEKIYEDLEGRFRLGEALDLLKGAKLYLPAPDDQENYVTVQLCSLWQERALGMAARSAIALAVRQRLGPGFKVNFCSA